MKPRVGVSGNVYSSVCEKLSLSPHEGFIDTSLDILLKYCVSRPYILPRTNFQERFKTKIFMQAHPGGG